MKRVLVSGATGFVGINLKSFFNSEADYEIIPLNLRETWSGDQLNEVSSIIHLAGKAHDLKNVLVPEEYYQVNFELTKNLYDAFLQSKAEKFIFLSTVKAAADQLNEPLTENHSPNPRTDYGKSKLQAEQYIQSQPLPEGKSYYIFRPCMIHGPGNKGNLNLLYKFVSKGMPYPLASYDNKRSFLSVENLCFVFKEVIDRNLPSGIYNISDDEAMSTNTIVTLLAEALQKPPRLLYLPKNVIYLLAMIGNFLKLPLNTERLGKLTENYIVSNKKIKQALKKELPLSSREGILKTALAFKDV